MYITFTNACEGGGIGAGWDDPAAEFVARLIKWGHVAIANDLPPWHHNLIGCGVGHNDADFAERGRSMAAYYENGDARSGRWWESTDSSFSEGVKYYGCVDRSPHGLCGSRTWASAALARQAVAS